MEKQRKTNYCDTLDIAVYRAKGMDYDNVTYLKGLAILAVLVNHYINHYVSGYHAGYANGIISLFFVLSGYGIYYSLKRRFGNSFKLTTLFKFYYDRSLRLYPIYLFALLLLWLNHEVSYNVFFYWGLASPWNFICRIIHCYILAPFIYLLLTRSPNRRFGCIITAALIIVNLLYILMEELNLGSIINNPIIAPIRYRSIFFSHTFLFSLGMAIPLYIKKLEIHISKILVFPFFIAFLLFVYLTRIGMPLFYYKQGISFVYLIFSVLVCYTAINSQIRFPFNKLFVILGIYTLPIFMFHGRYYYILQEMDIIQKDSVLSVAITILLFPIFLFICIFVQKVSLKFMKLLNSDSLLVER